MQKCCIKSGMCKRALLLFWKNDNDTYSESMLFHRIIEVYLELQSENSQEIKYLL
jgi:hypothetical protein